MQIRLAFLAKRILYNIDLVQQGQWGEFADIDSGYEYSVGTDLRIKELQVAGGRRCPDEHGEVSRITLQQPEGTFTCTPLVA